MEFSLNKELFGKMDVFWIVFVKMERLVFIDVMKGILFCNFDIYDRVLYGFWFFVFKNMFFKWWRVDIYD